MVFFPSIQITAAEKIDVAFSFPRDKESEMPGRYKRSSFVPGKPH